MKQNSHAEGPGISRRTIARGAAWSVPVALVATAAPALAASESACLTALWTDAAYSGAGGKWGFDFQFTNGCSSAAKVTSIEVFTTYHAPATGSTTDAVQSLKPNLTVKAGASATYVGTGSRKAFDPPPMIGSTNDLPRYYNDFSNADHPDDTDNDGKILCVAKDATATPVHPDDASYPPCARRLLDDATYAVITYTIGSTAYTEQVVFGSGVGCRVVAGCQDPR